MTTTPTSGAADLPEALRSIQRFEVVDCIDDKHVPAVIPNPHGPWVRYEDHIAALAAGQATAAPAQPAAQQGVAYAALPTSNYAGRVYEEGFLIGTCPLYTADQMRSFADATYMLRASPGQAPAQPDQPIACSYGDNGYACCEGGPCQADVHNDKLAEQQAPATAQAADSVQEDAARESEYRRGYRHGYEQRDAEVRGAMA